MRRKKIQLTASVLLIALCGVLYSCQYEPDGGADMILASDKPGGVLTDSEVDIKSEDNKTKDGGTKQGKVKDGEAKDDKAKDDKAKDSEAKDDKAKDSETKDSETEDVVCVYVCGAVKNTGVYTLHSGERIEAAVLAAGGFSEDADTAALNLAEHLTDGQKVYVPAVGEADDGQMDDHGGGADTGGLLDINRASASELMTLPGIGEVKAEQIVAYRETHGPFASVEALKEVPGIKDGVLEPIRALICAG